MCRQFNSVRRHTEPADIHCQPAFFMPFTFYRFLSDNTGMTIALFHSKINADTARSIGATMERQGLRVIYIDTSTRNSSADDTSVQVILPPESTHVLFFYASDEVSRRYYHFYSGFCLGRGLRFLLLDTEGAMDKNDPFIHLATVLTADTFESFMISEKIRFNEEEKIRRAKERLLERGISCFPESFLSVVVSGDIESARLFLEAGFSPELRDARGVAALSLAVRSQHPELVRLLAESGAGINDLSADRGYSPLMDAVLKGNEEICRILLEAGADVNLASKDGQTALIITAGRGDEILSRLLYGYGADPEIKDHLGMSASGYANLFKNEKLLALFNTPRS